MSNLEFTTLVSDGEATGSWETIACSNQIPVNAISVRLYVKGSDTDSDLNLLVYPVAGKAYGAHLHLWEYNQASVLDWVDMAKTGTRNLSYKADDNDDDAVQIRCKRPVSHLLPRRPIL